VSLDVFLVTNVVVTRLSDFDARRSYSSGVSKEAHGFRQITGVDAVWILAEH
jgi:hypothetical protein